MTTIGATFTIVSTTELTATVPIGAVTGRIRVTNPNATATSSSNFTVTYPTPRITTFTPAYGPVGTQVIITGTNFGGASAVRFGGVTTTNFTIESPTTIKVTVPATARRARVSVTTPGGTGTSAANFFVTESTNSPVITSFTPGSGPVGTRVTISGHNFIGVTEVKFNTTTVPHANVAVVNANTVTAIVPNGSTSGFITIRTPNRTATSIQTYSVGSGDDNDEGDDDRIGAEPEPVGEVNAYPNPLYDKVFIDLKGRSAAGAKTTLTDAVGRPVLQNANRVVGESLLELDLTGLRAGLYIIQLRTENTYTLIKVTKQ